MTIIIDVHCNDCGHDQTTEAINPVIDGDMLVTYLIGSAGHYCDKCDGSNVDQVNARYQA